jgi:DNA-binding transcriptional ArsR family regulator
MRKKKDSGGTPDVFAAIGDPTRREILKLLTAGALSVSVLAGNFDISRPAVSKHIRILKDAGLVHVDHAGREHFCTLDPKGFGAIRDWLSFYEGFWTANLARLEHLLAQRAQHNNT